MKKIIPLLFLSACYTAQNKPNPPDPVIPDLVLMRGETSEIRVGAGCPSLSVPSGLVVSVLEYRKVTTTHPSYLGAPVGDHKDVLIPCVTGSDGAWIDVTAMRNAVPGMYNLGPYRVLVLNADLPEKPTMSFYGEIVAGTIWQLEAIPDTGQALPQKAEAVKRWSQFLRAHRIEPIKQWWTTYPPMDLEAGKTQGADFLSVVVNDAIAPPMLIRYEPTSNPSAPVLQALEVAIQAGKISSDAWAYVRDEGQLGSNGQVSQSNLSLLLQKSALYRQHAPSMKQYATWVEIPELAQALDGTWPVAEWFLDPRFSVPYTKPYGLYWGCMSQGRCSNGSPAAQPTGTPLFTLDAPEIHPMMMPVMAYALGAKRAMYYRLDKKIRTAWDINGQYDEGGHADGTALYYLGGPQASVRLKAIRYGSNSVEYLRALGEDGKALVRSPVDWEKDKTLLSNLRIRLAKRLNQL